MIIIKDKSVEQNIYVPKNIDVDIPVVPAHIDKTVWECEGQIDFANRTDVIKQMSGATAFTKTTTMIENTFTFNQIVIPHMSITQYKGELDLTWKIATSYIDPCAVGYYCYPKTVGVMDWQVDITTFIPNKLFEYADEGVIHYDADISRPGQWNGDYIINTHKDIIAERGKFVWIFMGIDGYYNNLKANLLTENFGNNGDAAYNFPRMGGKFQLVNTILDFNVNWRTQSLNFTHPSQYCALLPILRYVKDTEVPDTTYHFVIVNRTTNVTKTYKVEPVVDADGLNYIFEFYDPELQNDEYEYQLYMNDTILATGIIAIGEYNKDKNIKMFSANIQYDAPNI